MSDVTSTPDTELVIEEVSIEDTRGGVEEFIKDRILGGLRRDGE